MLLEFVEAVALLAPSLSPVTDGILMNAPVITANKLWNGWSGMRTQISTTDSDRELKIRQMFATIGKMRDTRLP